MDKKSTLDFLVIGAMRSGTTTLYELLKQHPQLLIPPGKEVPFFSEDEYYRKGLEWYISQNFDRRQDNKLWGTITPQYMLRAGMPTVKIAHRIKKYLPEVKIIAILRHPVARAYSHYKFAVRHGFEQRSFDQAIIETIASKNAEKAETAKTNQIYLLRSMYGQCLKPYFDLFNRNQILVLFTEDLEKNPKGVLDSIYDHLDIKNKYYPDTTGKIFHRGGVKAKVPQLTHGATRKYKKLRKLYRTIIPYRLRKRFEMWLYIWNTKQDSAKIKISKKTKDRLKKYFANDLRLLKSLLRTGVPWNQL